MRVAAPALLIEDGNVAGQVRGVAHRGRVGDVEWIGLTPDR